MRVMIVEDHSEMRRVLKNIVTLALKDPVDMMECENGEDAVANYTAFNPDYVLMDLQLSNMNGFEATQNLIELDQSAKIIIISSYNLPRFRQRAKELNTQAFICKDELSELDVLLQNIGS